MPKSGARGARGRKLARVVSPAGSEADIEGSDTSDEGNLRADFLRSQSGALQEDVLAPSEGAVRGEWDERQSRHPAAEEWEAATAAAREAAMRERRPPGAAKGGSGASPSSGAAGRLPWQRVRGGFNAVWRSGAPCAWAIVGVAWAAMRYGILPRWAITDVRAVCWCVMAFLTLNAHACDHMLGLCLHDKELEKRFVEERVGYARTPVGQIGIVTLVVWYVHELRLLYEPSLSFALVTAIYLAIVNTYPNMIMAPPSGLARPLRPLNNVELPVTNVSYIRMVAFVVVPLWWTLVQNQTFLQDAYYPQLNIVGIPLMCLVLPGFTFADFLATRFSFCGFFAVYHWYDVGFWGPLCGSAILMYIFRRVERECFETEAKANQRLSTALHFLSHETRNQLMPSMTIVEDQEFDPPSDKQAVMVALGTVTSILNNVLAMAQLRSGNATFPTRPFDLRDFLDVSFSIGRNCARAGVRFDLVPRSALLPRGTWVQGSLPALTQVLSNVVSNASKFTSSGTIVLAWEILEHATSIDVTLVCRDTGCGIPEDKVPQLLSEFARVRCTTNENEGTGLGLPLSKRIVETLGGTFELRSAVGAGTAVRIAINLRRASSATGMTADGSHDKARTVVARMASRICEPLTQSSLMHRDVLVVDDSRLCRMVLGRAAKKCGLSVTYASDGLEALEHVQRRHVYGLIIMDNEMPSMNGLDATAAIRAFGYGGAIVMVTGNAHTDDEIEDLRLTYGLDFVFTKGERPSVDDLLVEWSSSRRSA